MKEFFKKKKKDDFMFVGNRNYLRSEREMIFIDKESADNAFKKYKKEIIDQILLDKGFCKWKSNAYVRLNEIGLLEYIDLQKERYGSKTLCVNFAIMPLYCGQKFMVTGLGDRLGKYISGRDVWWDYCNDEIAKVSFTNITEAMIKFMFPWFFEYALEENYRKRLLEDKNRKFVGYPVDEWLEALNLEDKEVLMQNATNELKLPKKILKV